MKTVLNFLLLAVSLNASALTFREAKNELKNLYRDFPSTFYCGCEINWVTKKKLVPNLGSCGYKNRRPALLNRAQRNEFEHIVPAWEFGHQRLCWQKGKRKYCSRSDRAFQQMEGDLHNLVPTVGEVNADRSNYRYGMIPNERRMYGSCDAEVDFKSRVFEPTDNVRGDVARVYMYFSQRYGLRISRKQQQLFSAWSKQDPVDDRECEIERKKTILQGNPNPFVRNACNSKQL